MKENIKVNKNDCTDSLSLAITPRTNFNKNRSINTINNFTLSELLSSQRQLNSSNNIPSLSNFMNMPSNNDCVNSSCLVTEEKLRKMFNIVNNQEVNKEKFGPKVNFKNFPVNKSFDSFEINLEFASNEEVFDIHISKQEEDEGGEEESESVNTEKKDSKGNNEVIENNTQLNKLDPNEHYSIKIDNSRNEFKAPSIYTRNLYTENNQSNNNIVITKENSDNKKGGWCVCNKPNKRRTKSFQNTSTYSSGNVTHTKKSTNLSFKSLKLNDSLNKLRKKKSASINGDCQNTFPSAKEKTSCKCLIF